MKVSFFANLVILRRGAPDGVGGMAGLGVFLAGWRDSAFFLAGWRDSNFGGMRDLPSFWRDGGIWHFFGGMWDLPIFFGGMRDLPRFFGGMAGFKFWRDTGFANFFGGMAGLGTPLQGPLGSWPAKYTRPNKSHTDVR